MLPCWAHGSLMRLYILIKAIKTLTECAAFLACHMSFTKWRFWKLMQVQKMQLDCKTMVMNQRSSNGRCSKKEKVWVRKQHWAVEGSQTGPLEDGTWGILAICLSFVLSYKVSAPFIMLRQRGAWLWYREYGLGSERRGISEDIAPGCF